MEFEWDRHNVRHLARHKVTPREFEEAMRSNLIYISVEEVGGEERWYALGATSGLRVLGLVYTYRGDSVRPVTAHDVRRKLRELYLRETGGEIDA